MQLITIKVAFPLAKTSRKHIPGIHQPIKFHSLKVGIFIVEKTSPILRNILTNQQQQLVHRLCTHHLVCDAINKNNMNLYNQCNQQTNLAVFQ